MSDEFPNAGNDDVRPTPPPLPRPQASPPRGPARPGKHRAPWVGVAVIGPLVLLALLVLVVLPRWIDRRERVPVVEPSPSAGVPIDPEAPPVPKTEPEAGSPPPVQARSAEPPAETAADEAPSPKPDAGAGVDAERAVGSDEHTEQQRFAQAMSEVLRALDEGDHVAARTALGRAEILRPGSPAVTEARWQLEQSETSTRIARALREAVAAEKREDWHAAASGYASVLAIDPTVSTARAGQERASERADLQDRLDYHIAHPSRLAAAAVYEEARTLLERAATVEPAGPEHRRRVETLSEVLRVAGTPIPVTLISDGETQVTVYKVGRLGAFERRVIELRPGTYTVVGSRPGYRDVRASLVVRPGETATRLTLKCEEPV